MCAPSVTQPPNVLFSKNCGSAALCWQEGGTGEGHAGARRMHWRHDANIHSATTLPWHHILQATGWVWVAAAAGPSRQCCCHTRLHTCRAGCCHRNESHTCPAITSTRILAHASMSGMPLWQIVLRVVASPLYLHHDSVVGHGRAVAGVQVTVGWQMFLLAQAHQTTPKLSVSVGTARGKHVQAAPYIVKGPHGPHKARGGRHLGNDLIAARGKQISRRHGARVEHILQHQHPRATQRGTQ